MSRSSPVCTPARSSGVMTLGWTTTIIPLANVNSGTLGQRAAPGPEDRRQIATDKAVHEIIANREAGLVDHSRGVDEVSRGGAGAQALRDRVKGRVGDRVQLAVQRRRLGRDGEGAQELTVYSW